MCPDTPGALVDHRERISERPLQWGGLRGLRSERARENAPRADVPRRFVPSVPPPAPLDRPLNPFDTPLEHTAPAVREE